MKSLATSNKTVGIVLSTVNVVALLALSLSLQGRAVESTAPSVDAAEREAILETVQHYIDGAATNDAAHFEAAFHLPGATMQGVRTDRETGKQTLRVTPIERAIQGWTRNEPAESWGKVTGMNVVDDKLAHVTLELLFMGHVYVDVMTLYKINDEWKIVNKTYVSRGRASEQ